MAVDSVAAFRHEEGMQYTLDRPGKDYRSGSLKTAMIVTYKRQQTMLERQKDCIFYRNAIQSHWVGTFLAEHFDVQFERLSKKSGGKCT